MVIEMLDILKLELALRFLKSGKALWETKDHKKLNIHNREEISDSHLINIINMLERDEKDHQRYEETEWSPYDEIEGLTIECCNL